MPVLASGEAMRRREFITLLGGAAAWPLAARAQQTAMPVIGFINADSSKGHAPEVSAFLRGLREAGYIDGQNVAIESGSDPIELGLVASLSRPGGNVTGVTQSNAEIAPKRLELLHELLPTARTMALLVNPDEPAIAEPTAKEVVAAARILGLELHVLNASSEADFDGVFAKLSQLQAGGLVIVAGPGFTGHREQLGSLTLRHAMPAIFQHRAFTAAGGLMSYGSDITDAYRLTGIYTGRILKGDKPADLPVQQATKVELYINLKTAKALGISIPLPLSGRANELIE